MTAQIRTHNAQNGILTGPGSMSYDANRNTTADGSGETLVYAAWNRQVAVKNSGGTAIASYRFDAMTRRVTETVSRATTNVYFSTEWQVLEERLGGMTQYISSPVYVDAMVLRDRDTATDGIMDERLYVAQDANFNVTALIDTSGAVVQRFQYDRYGTPTVLNATWTATTDGYAWRYMHQGGRYEAVSGEYNFRNRELNPALGRWMSVDPIGFAGGDANWYRDRGERPNAWRLWF